MERANTAHAPSSRRLGVDTNDPLVLVRSLADGWDGQKGWAEGMGSVGSTTGWMARLGDVLLVDQR